MNVTYCDLCQKPITGKEYRMTLEEKSLFSNPLTTRSYDLCGDCYTMIADMMEHKTDEISAESKDCDWVKEIVNRLRGQKNED